MVAVVVYAIWAYANPKIRGIYMLLADGFLVGLCGILIPAIIRKVANSYDAWFSDLEIHVETRKRNPSLSRYEVKNPPHSITKAGFLALVAFLKEKKRDAELAEISNIAAGRI